MKQPLPHTEGFLLFLTVEATLFGVDDAEGLAFGGEAAEAEGGLDDAAVGDANLAARAEVREDCNCFSNKGFQSCFNVSLR